MTKIRLAASAAPSESTSTTSPRAFTPDSDIAGRITPSPAPGTGVQGQDPSPRSDGVVHDTRDAVIPSIETDSTASLEESSSTGRAAHVRTPSVSVSPPPPSTTSRSQATSPVGNPENGAPMPRGGRSDSLAARLGSMNLSPPASSLGMSDMAAALEDAASSDEQLPLPEPGASDLRSQSSVRPSPRRRSRVSSQANIAPHNVEDEELPANRFHDPTVQQAFADAKALMASLAIMLGSGSLHLDPDSTIRRLYKQAGDLAQFRLPSSRTVGFVGDSGVGKSSLLNSLLDYKDLARADSSGAACTCVVTEYHYHDRDDFAIDVDLFSVDELMAQVANNLQSYRQYHLHGQDLAEGDEKEELKERADLAIDTFRAMFRGRLDSEQFLQTEREEVVLETLRSWAQDLRPSQIDGQQTRSTLTNCSDLLMQLTSDVKSSQERAAWPYIRKINVYLRAHILGKGLVLVDLPGLRDLNSARRAITERYLLKCDEIFAVCLIDRATTDAGVASVFDLARQARLSNVGIICTKSDVIRPEESKRNYEGPKRVQVEKLFDAVASSRRDLDKIEAELKGYDDYDDDLSEEERQDQADLSRRSRQTRKVWERKKFDLKRYLIDDRNVSVTGQLEALYRNRIPGDGVKVFCISNTDYWDNRYLPKDEALPLIYLSGIPEIRKHCLSMVASSQLRIATKYVRDDIPALLGDVALWVESGAGSMDAEQKRAIREALDKVEKGLTTQLTGRDSLITSLARSMKQGFDDQVYNNGRIDDWSRGAIDAGYVWAGWSPGTYAAFCRNFGHHRTKAVEWHNWNEEAMETMVRDLEASWGTLRSTLSDQYKNATALIADLMEWSIHYFDAELEKFPDLTSTLSQTLESRENILVAEIEDLCYKFGTGLSSLRTDALSGMRTSIFGRAMEGTYEACKHETGTGSWARQKQIMNQTLARRELFVDLVREFRMRFNGLADELQSGVQAAVRTHLGDIRLTLDMIRSDNVATESEQNPEFRLAVDAQVTAARAEVQELKKAFVPAG